MRKHIKEDLITKLLLSNKRNKTGILAFDYWPITLFLLTAISYVFPYIYLFNIFNKTHIPHLYITITGTLMCETIITYLILYGFLAGIVITLLDSLFDTNILNHHETRKSRILSAAPIIVLTILFLCFVIIVSNTTEYSFIDCINILYNQSKEDIPTLMLLLTPIITVLMLAFYLTMIFSKKRKKKSTNKVKEHKIKSKCDILIDKADNFTLILFSYVIIVCGLVLMAQDIPKYEYEYNVYETTDTTSFIKEKLVPVSVQSNITLLQKISHEEEASKTKNNDTVSTKKEAKIVESNKDDNNKQKAKHKTKFNNDGFYILYHSQPNKVYHIRKPQKETDKKNAHKNK